MHSELIKFCSTFVALSTKEETLLTEVFKPIFIKRKSFLLKEGEKCNFIAFIKSGGIRHFHIKDGEEITCDISIAPCFITDFVSFNKDIPSKFNFKAINDTQVLCISNKDLNHLYKTSPVIEQLGRIMAEQVAERATEISLSLISQKPEERVEQLLANRPELFQLVSQRHLANLVGVTPESFSRIRSRIAKKVLT